jgi:hypothetical protein
MPEQARENDAIAGGRSSPSAQGDQYSGNQNNRPNTPPPGTTAPKAAAPKEAAPKAAAPVAKQSNNPFAGVGDWFSNMFGDTSNDTEEEKSDSVGQGLMFLSNPFTSALKGIFKEGQTGMNDEAKDEWSLLNQEASRNDNSSWHSMSDAEKAYLARKPQVDNQLPHAFIDGNPVTSEQKAIAALTGGKAPGYTVYNGDGSVNIERTAMTAGNGNGDGNGGQGGQQAPAAPNWWEEGYQQPINGGGGQLPGFGGGQQVQGLPGYLQNELAPTPDFTGSYQSSLLGNTALPSQQITGLLAPQQQQPQQYNFTAPQQQPQITREMLQGLLGGSNGFIG